MWEVYEKAKNEFDGEFNREDRDDRVAFVAAKFLRDTAENLLTQLRDQTVSEVVLEELNGTYNMAKAMVVSSLEVASANSTRLLPATASLADLAIPVQEQVQDLPTAALRT